MNRLGVTIAVIAAILGLSVAVVPIQAEEPPVLGLKTWPPAEWRAILLKQDMRLPIIGENASLLLPKGSKVYVLARRRVSWRKVQNRWQPVIIPNSLVNEKEDVSVYRLGKYLWLPKEGEGTAFTTIIP